MTDIASLIHPFRTLSMIWIFLLGILLLWAVARYLIVPVLKKRAILEAIPYCPSLLLPQLPDERDTITLVPSHKLKFFNYRVNLFHLTCTCPRFRQVRGHYPPNDIRRLCRHLRKELDATQCSSQFDELTRGVIGFRLRDSCYVREPLTNSEMIVGFHPRSSIIRVYTYRKNPQDPPHGPFTGKVEKFTYNNQQEIWVYGDPPPNSEEILTAIARIMTSCKANYPHQDKLPTTRDHLIVPRTENDETNKTEEITHKRSSVQPSTTPLQAKNPED